MKAAVTGTDIMEVAATVGITVAATVEVISRQDELAPYKFPCGKISLQLC